jgi:hypothetical protein
MLVTLPNITTPPLSDILARQVSFKTRTFLQTRELLAHAENMIWAMGGSVVWDGVEWSGDRDATGWRKGIMLGEIWV